MKKFLVNTNAFMAVVILFAILFQSLHSYEHLVKEIITKKCLHKHVSSKQITHQHTKFDKCFVCEFAFSSFITSNIQSFSYCNDSNFYKNDSCFLTESNDFFSGISYSLRGPPIV